jgi:energy-converting hydrogenase A subunit R
VRRVFISDCEGPISKNDNALETTAHYVPDGDKVFTIISRYDDVLVDIVKKQGYQAGGTLKLVLPFLRVFGATDAEMRELAARNLLLMPDIKDTLLHIRPLVPTYIVSTSYEHYIRSLCQALTFPFRNTFCTRLRIDKYGMTAAERDQLKRYAKEISEMPMFNLPVGARKLSDLSPEAKRVTERLDEIFWTEIANMRVGEMYVDVNPIGGSEKASAIKSVVEKFDVGFENVMYVGDSITDVEAFRLVKENDGLAVSFNGNHYAVRNADVAVLSDTSIPTGIIAHVFINSGKEEALRLAENWSRRGLTDSQVSRNLLNHLFVRYPSKLPKVKIITPENMETLSRESSRFRKKVRGEGAGRLG